MRNLANDVQPFYEPGGFPTCFATTAISGKRFVTISGNRTSGPGLVADADPMTEALLAGVYRVKQCDASGQWAVGVAKTDALINKPVGVIAKPGIILPVLAGAAIAFGIEVMSDAQGRAIPFVAGGGAVAVGRAMTAAADATDAEIKLY